MIAIAAFLFAWVWIDVLRMPERYRIFAVKPLSCLLCLSFWSGVVLYLLPVFIQELAFYSLGAAGLATIYLYAKSKDETI